MKNEKKLFPVIQKSESSDSPMGQVFLDGMEVLFDKKVGLYPVNLLKKIDKNNGKYNETGK